MNNFNKPYNGTSLARLLLYVDDLLPFNLARYNRDIDIKSYFIPLYDSKVCEVNGVEEILLPTFEINSLDYWNKKLCSKEIIHKKEDLFFFKLLFESLDKNLDTKIISKCNQLYPIIEAMVNIEDHDLDVDAFICSRQTFRKLSLIEHKHFYVTRKGDEKGPFKIGGSLFNIPIYIHENAKDYFFAVSSPENLGVMPIRSQYAEKDILVVKDEKSINKSTIQQTVGYEEITMVIMDNRCVSAVEFTN